MLLTPQTIYADSTGYQTEVVNHVSIGDISISLEEFGEDEAGNLIPYQNPNPVLPGQQIRKIVQITNQAKPAWVRVKLEYTSEDGLNGLSDEMVTLTDEDKWVQADGYYYYTSPMEQSEMVTFMEAVRIPPEWDNSYAGRSFSIIITADAVQEDNFTPDFTRDDPWFGTVIEACVHSGYQASAQTQTAFSVAFEGGAEGLVRTGEDFFSNFGELMPGDTVSDEVTVQNQYRHPVRIYFRTETIADDELLKKLTLEIKNGDTVLYAGTLDGAVTKATQIARLNRGEGARLTYTLHVPAELTNPYALAKTKTKWIFSAEIVSSGGDSGGDPGGSHDTPSGPQPPQNPGPGVEDITQVPPFPEFIQELAHKGGAFIGILPETGDQGSTWPAVFLVLASGIGIIALLRIRRREKKREH